MKNVSDIAYAVPESWDKEFIIKMINRLGKEETIKRWSFQLELPDEETALLIENYLTDNWVDDKGIFAGKYFYGEL